jgi:osmotically inducible lipoprotein OsmB
MKTMQSSTVTRAFVGALLVLALGGCASMSTQDKNTAIGAGAGGVAGGVLTGGSTVGILGGAAVGGLLGHQWERITD